jgi:hypothetical protein
MRRKSEGTFYMWHSIGDSMVLLSCRQLYWHLVADRKGINITLERHLSTNTLRKTTGSTTTEEYKNKITVLQHQIINKDAKLHDLQKDLEIQAKVIDLYYILLILVQDIENLKQELKSEKQKRTKLEDALNTPVSNSALIDKLQRLKGICGKQREIIEKLQESVH